MSKVFRVRPEAYQRDVRSRQARVFLWFGTVAVAFIWLGMWAGDIGLSNLFDLGIWTRLFSALGGILFTLGLVCVVLVIAVQVIAKENRSNWDSIQVEIADDYVARRQSDRPEVRLQRDEIKKLEEGGNFLRLYSVVRHRSLDVPKLLDGYDEVKGTLSTWGKPLRSNQKRLRILNRAFAVLGVVGIFGSVFAVHPGLRLILLCGMLGAIGYFGWYMGPREHPDPRVRTGYLLVMAGIAASWMCQLLIPAVIISTIPPVSPAEQAFRQCDAELDRNALDRAIDDCTKAIALAPSLAQAYEDRGFAYALQNKLELATADFTTVIALDPTDPKAYSNRGEAFYQQDKFEQAAIDYTEAIRLAPSDPNSYFRRALCHHYEGHLEQAIADYSKVIELVPWHTESYNNRGNAYDDLGEADQAIADYSKAIELEPKSGLAYLNRGIAYGRQNQNGLAIIDLQMYLMLTPNTPNRDFVEGLIKDLE